MEGILPGLIFGQVLMCECSIFYSGLREDESLTRTRGSFFKAPFYEQKVVEYAEATKQPFGLMEIISLSITDVHSPKFTGPVLVSPLLDSLYFVSWNEELLISC